MSDPNSDMEWTYRWGAKIKMPCDVPDDIGKDAVQETDNTIVEMENAMSAAGEDFKWEEHGTDVVKKVKGFFDQKYGPAWHVFIGKDFGAHVTHVSRTFIYFYLGDKAVMIFKA